MLSSNRQHEKQTLLHLVHSGMSLRQLSRKERVVLGAICLCTLALLAALQHGRVFLGDEIGTLRYLKESPSYILTHFGTWLSMNYFILVEKGVAWLCGAADWRLTLLPIAAAVAIIPLTASLALKFTGSTRTALIAASLAAFNHFLLLLGPADSRVFAPSGVESIGNQRVLSLVSAARLVERGAVCGCRVTAVTRAS